MTNKDIIVKFYDAFQEGNSSEMNKLYSKDAVFKDDVFGTLDYIHVTNMWEMLLKRRDEIDFALTYEIIEEDGQPIAIWTSKYLFGPKKRKVTNVVKSKMLIKDNLIVEHTDSFKFKKWAKQSIGGPAKLFGNAKWFKNKISTVANQNLENYIKNKNN